MTNDEIARATLPLREPRDLLHRVIDGRVDEALAMFDSHQAFRDTVANIWETVTVRAGECLEAGKLPTLSVMFYDPTSPTEPHEQQGFTVALTEDEWRSLAV